MAGKISSLVTLSLFIVANVNYSQVSAQFQQNQNQQQQFQNFNLPNRLFPFQSSISSTASQFFQQPVQFVQRLQRQFFNSQNVQQQQPQQPSFVNQPPRQSSFQQPQQQPQFQQQQFQNVPQRQLEPPRNNGQSFNQIQQQFPQQSQFDNQNQQTFQTSQNQIPQQTTTVESIRLTRQQPMTEVCLACICQASTSCNLTTRCVSGGQYCGPFLISKPYWLDAGQPVLLGDSPSRAGAFEDCAADPVCSAQTVRTYMTKYMKDCNGDGRIDCIDLASIHLMGQSGCVSPMVSLTPFFQRFQQCFAKASTLSV